MESAVCHIKCNNETHISSVTISGKEIKGVAGIEINRDVRIHFLNGATICIRHNSMNHEQTFGMVDEVAALIKRMSDESMLEEKA